MKKKLAVLATEDDLLVDLTFHNVPAFLDAVGYALLGR
jgi:hypothetical protein